MFENLEDYIGYKCVEALVLNPEEGLDEQADIPFLQCVLNYVNICAENFSLDLKERILTGLSDLRFIDDKDKVERFKIINQIIEVLNTTKKDASYSFYKGQLNDRFNGKITYISNSIVETVNALIYYDYLILQSHTDLMSDEEFYEDAISEFTEWGCYYSNIGFIIKEYPDIMKDKKFIERFKSIHQMNKQNNFKFDKIDKSYVQKTLKKMKAK